MKPAGWLKLREREFAVKRAYVIRSVATWWLEVECDRAEFDGEWWEPRLYHHGLQLAAEASSDLPGIFTSWDDAHARNYPHPEIGALYVFGHHLVREGKIQFSQIPSGGLSMNWRGTSDVLWDNEFGENVPFECETRVEAREE